MGELKSFKIEVISRETIKPSSPSPTTTTDQPHFKLSFLDQLARPVYMPTLFFYKGGGGGGGGSGVDERSETMKSSLSETLTRFYPFAGRLKDDLSILCNDEGVEYSEARVLGGHSLSDVLQKPNPLELAVFLPEEQPPQLQDITARPLLLFQANFFPCGGIALGMKYCHKVGDGSTFASFVKSWAASASGKPDLLIPDFTAASAVFPPTDFLVPLKLGFNEEDKPAYRATRLVFGPSELAALQAKATGTGGDGNPQPKPSRLEAVSAFLWKTAFKAKREESGSPDSSTMMVTVNLRSRLSLPPHCFGNVVWSSVSEGDVAAKDLPAVADQLRLGIKQVSNNYIQMLERGDDVVKEVSKMRMIFNDVIAKFIAGTTEMYIISTQCKLPLYESDFGWGKPVWVAAGGLDMTPNVFVLSDTSDGQGIEALVVVTEEVAIRMESNEELQNYASFNPCAFN